MWKKIVGVLLAVGVGFLAFDYFSAGLHTRPEMPNGAFSLSYKNGMRAILVGVPNEKASRRYFGFAMKVPFYLEDAWSFCAPPTEIEIAEIMAARGGNPGERIEGVCKIDADGDVVVRGFVTSVPKL